MEAGMGWAGGVIRSEKNEKTTRTGHILKSNFTSFSFFFLQWILEFSKARDS